MKIVYLILFCLFSFVLFLNKIGTTITPNAEFIYRKATYLIPDDQIPSDAISTAEHSIYSFLYRGLFVVNGELEIQSDLVEEWYIDEKIHSYFFKITNNDKFSNNEPLTSDNVVDSLKYLFFKSKNSGSFLNIQSILKKDSSWIQIRVKNTKDPLIPLLASPQAKIWKNNLSDKQPLGSGPYVIFSKNSSPKELTIEKNKNYQGHLKYNLKKIKFIQMTESEAKIAISENRIDDTVDIPLTSIIQDGSNIKKLESPTAITWLVTFNVKSGFLKSLKNRQCLIEKFNKVEFIKRFLPTHEAAIGYLPTSIPGSKVTQNNINIDCSMDKKSELTILIPEEIENTKSICMFFNNTWKGLLSHVSCKIVPFSKLLIEISKGRHQSALLAMSMDFPAVEYFLNAFESHSSFNLSNYSSIKIDKLLQKSREETDRNLKTKYYQEINQILFNKALSLNISYPKYIAYTNSSVTGLNLSIAGPSFTDYTEVQLEHK